MRLKICLLSGILVSLVGLPGAGTAQVDEQSGIEGMIDIHAHVVFPECAHVREYDKLSDNAKHFMEQIEENTGRQVTLVGTGEDIKDTIDRR